MNSPCTRYCCRQFQVLFIWRPPSSSHTLSISVFLPDLTYRADIWNVGVSSSWFGFFLTAAYERYPEPPRTTGLLRPKMLQRRFLASWNRRYQPSHPFKSSISRLHTPCLLPFHLLYSIKNSAGRRINLHIQSQPHTQRSSSTRVFASAPRRKNSYSLCLWNNGPIARKPKWKNH